MRFYFSIWKIDISLSIWWLAYELAARIYFSSTFRICGKRYEVEVFRPACRKYLEYIITLPYIKIDNMNQRVISESDGIETMNRVEPYFSGKIFWHKLGGE